MLHGIFRSLICVHVLLTRINLVPWPRQDSEPQTPAQSLTNALPISGRSNQTHIPPSSAVLQTGFDPASPVKARSRPPHVLEKYFLLPFSWQLRIVNRNRSIFYFHGIGKTPDLISQEPAVCRDTESKCQVRKSQLKVFLLLQTQSSLRRRPVTTVTRL